MHLYLDFMDNLNVFNPNDCCSFGFDDVTEGDFHDYIRMMTECPFWADRGFSWIFLR